MPDLITIPELADAAGVSEDDTADVLAALVRQGWLNEEHVQFNVRSRAGPEWELELPDDSDE